MSVAWLMAALLMSASWITICARAEEKEHLNPLLKRRVKRWLAPRLYESDERPDWSEAFTNLLDRTFGERVLSWRFLGRSILATTIFFVLSFLVFVGAGLITFEGAQQLLGPKLDIWTTWQWVLLVFAGNLLADYVSLAETKILLSLIRGRGRWVSLLGLAIDAILTTAIFLFFASFLYEVELLWQPPERNLVDHIVAVFGVSMDASEIETTWGSNSTTFFEVWGLLLQDISPAPSTDWPFLSDIYQVSFITTFLTSIWILLFILAGLLGRIFFVVEGQITRIGRLFDVERKPVSALGYVLAIITFLLNLGCYSAVQAFSMVSPPGGGEETASEDS